MLLSAKSSWLVPDVLPKVWASLNGVLLKGVEISTISTVEKDDVPPKGLALVAADSTIGDDDGSVLIRVPERFVISLDRIAQLSNEDEKLQAILHACTDLIEVSVISQSRLEAMEILLCIVLYMHMEVRAEQ